MWCAGAKRNALSITGRHDKGNQQRSGAGTQGATYGRAAAMGGDEVAAVRTHEDWDFELRIPFEDH